MCSKGGVIDQMIAVRQWRQSCQIARLSDCKIVRLADCQIVRLSDWQIVRLQDWQWQVGQKIEQGRKKRTFHCFFQAGKCWHCHDIPNHKDSSPKECLIRELGDNNLFKNKEALSGSFMNRRRSGYCNLGCTRPAVFCGHLYFAAPVFIDRRDSKAATTYRSGGTGTTGWHRYVH